MTGFTNSPQRPVAHRLTAMSDLYHHLPQPFRWRPSQNLQNAFFTLSSQGIGLLAQDAILIQMLNSQDASGPIILHDLPPGLFVNGQIGHLKISQHLFLDLLDRHPIILAIRPKPIAGTFQGPQAAAQDLCILAIPRLYCGITRIWTAQQAKSSWRWIPVLAKRSQPHSHGPLGRQK